MPISSFYAQLIGIFMLIMSVTWISRQQQVEAAIKDLFASKGALALSGSFALLFGITIALTHTVWAWNYQGLVTLIGYLLIARGICRLGYPHWSQRVINKALRHHLWVIFIMFVIGFYLTYQGMMN